MDEIVFVELPILGIGPGGVRRLAPQDEVLTDPHRMVAGLVHSGPGDASDRYCTPVPAGDIAVGAYAYVVSPELTERFGRTTWRLVTRVAHCDDAAREEAIRAASARVEAAQAELAAANAALSAVEWP